MSRRSNKLQQIVNGDPPRRLMELRILICAKSLNFTTNQWLSDRPARPITSVAHCRAALEQALRERLGLQLTGVFIPFRTCSRERSSGMSLMIRRKILRVMKPMQRTK